MVNCFSLSDFPNLWHLWISLSTISSSNPRFLTRTFPTFPLIWTSVSPSAGLILSTRTHACRWYCWRSFTSFSSSEFVFFAIIRELPVIPLSALVAWFLLAVEIFFFLRFDSIESCLFSVFIADGVVVWLCFCLLLELVWFFSEERGGSFIFLFGSCFRSFEVFLNVLHWSDLVSGSLEVVLRWLNFCYLRSCPEKSKKG